ncbi:MAG: hypothetical protein GY847_08630 [Proteobacteria bacterium]|nr:hypothetical protein [Pseudomonadota bacterium]
MDTGAHIPAYLFCEQFIEQESVLDIFPPDEQGTRLLAKTAKSVVVVHSGASHHIPIEDDKLKRIVASPGDLPFARDSFDLVFFFAKGEHAHLARLDGFLRSARSLVSQKGLIALVIPNRDAKILDEKPDPNLPGFFDLERAIRRHFPHVTILAERPLHGAVLTPLGRKESSQAPLLDDRLLPDGGETPSHFVALCSPRYRKIDDTIIAQQPHGIFVDRINELLEQFRGKMTIARNESEMRAREIQRLEMRVEEMGEEAGMAEILKREKALALSRLSEAERQSGMRNELLAESEQAYEGQSLRLAEVEQKFHDSKRRIRQADQRTIELNQKLDQAIKEREDAEKELKRVLEGLRSTRAETKAKQRELDDIREEAAGVEADLTAMREESNRQRREALSARERSTQLELEIKDLKDRQIEANSLEAELTRVRKLAASERERLERRIEEEHKCLIEEKNTRSATEQHTVELKNRIDKAEAAAVAAEQRRDALEDKLNRLKQERDFLARDQKEANKAGKEMARLAKQNADETKRFKHQIELLSGRAIESEKRADLMSAKLKELHTGLEEAETELAQSRNAKVEAAEQIKALEDKSARLGRDLEAADREKSAILDDVQGLTSKNNSLEEDLSRTMSSLTYEKEQARTAIQHADEMELRQREARDRIGELENALEKAIAAASSTSEKASEARVEQKEIEKRFLDMKRALADTEEERTAMEAEMHRLVDDKEKELLKVSGDLEKELRYAASQVEAGHGEIWKLREEILRLQAQAAASEAADEHEKEQADLMAALVDREDQIARLSKERDELKQANKKHKQAVQKQATSSPLTNTTKEKASLKKIPKKPLASRLSTSKTKLNPKPKS